MGPTRVLSAPGGPHVGPMNLAIRNAIMWNFRATKWKAQIVRDHSKGQLVLSFVESVRLCLWVAVWVFSDFYWQPSAPKFEVPCFWTRSRRATLYFHHPTLTHVKDFQPHETLILTLWLTLVLSFCTVLRGHLFMFPLSQHTLVDNTSVITPPCRLLCQ